ncbi:MAG: hypothetical protein JRH20_18565 [Deltaproteobacteria bacterium]|nr:hypothetical protein [Deltaproteobacteria bacterium]
MKTAEDIESFMIRMDANYDTLGESIWVVTEGATDLVISIAGPVLVCRVKLLDLDRVVKDRREAFFQTLLQLNAEEMLHGAYGLEEGFVVATDALELENLDYNEFQATVDDLAMTVSKHYPLLNKFLTDAAA